MRYNAVYLDRSPRPARTGQKGPHAMQRIPPSQKIRQRINDLLNNGLEGEEDIMTHLFRLGAERLIQEILEQEVTDYLGREHYQRREPGQEHRGYRNGYEPGHIDTAEGVIQVQVPQVRATATACYRSQLMEFLRGNSDVLERLAVEMYARACRRETLKMPWKKPPVSDC